MRSSVLLLLVVAVLPAFVLPGLAAGHATARQPMMGLSTWNSFGLAINESLILELAQALVSRGAVAAGYTMVAIDDGWGQLNRNASGCIVADPIKFPGGMLALGQKIHQMGLQLGLYTARSNFTCSNKMPGSLGHELVDAQTFAYYGADYLKNDDCHVIYARAAEDYGAMERALQAQVRPILHDVKAPDLTPQEAVNVSQFRRVAKDLKNTWWDMVRVLDTGDDDSYLSVVGPSNSFFSDFDMLEIGNDAGDPGSMTMVEWQSHFSLWAAFKSPLQIGCDIRRVNQSVMDLMLNKEVIAVNQDALGQPVRRLRSYAPAANDNITKVYLAPCVNASADASMAVRQQWTLRFQTEDTVELVQADGRCLEVYDCQNYWPFMLSVSACGPGNAQPDRCNITASQQWRFSPYNHSHSSGRFVSNITGCWPGSGGESSDANCCASVEGSNVEIDKCEWSTIATRDVWKIATDGTIRAGLDGRCLTLAGNLEVYGGPLSGGRATAVLFNRSPVSANITLQFTDLEWPADTTATVRDIWRGQNLTASGSYTTEVAAHAVAHLVLSPKSRE